MRHNNNNNNKKNTNSITFGTVSTYFFPVIIGDSPAVREGCPIALGTKCVSSRTLDLRTHEMMVLVEQQQRQEEQQQQQQQQQTIDQRNENNYYPDGRLRRRKDLYIPVMERSTLLLDQGYTVDEIVAAVLAVEDAKKLRTESINKSNGGSGWQHIFKGVFHSSGKTFRNVLTVNNRDNVTSHHHHKKNTTSTSDKSLTSPRTTKPNTIQARSA
jgi:hypothetical protein